MFEVRAMDWSYESSRSVHSIQWNFVAINYTGMYDKLLIDFHQCLPSLPTKSLKFSTTHVKISQLVTSLQTSRQQDVFALLVPKLSTSCSKLVDNL